MQKLVIDNAVGAGSPHGRRFRSPRAGVSIDVCISRPLRRKPVHPEAILRLRQPEELRLYLAGNGDPPQVDPY